MTAPARITEADMTRATKAVKNAGFERAHKRAERASHTEGAA